MADSGDAESGDINDGSQLAGGMLDLFIQTLLELKDKNTLYAPYPNNFSITAPHIEEQIPSPLFEELKQLVDTPLSSSETNNEHNILLPSILGISTQM